MSEYFAALDSTTIGLTHSFWVNPLSCENPGHYEHFIRYCACDDHNAGRNVTHLFLHEDDDSGEKQILGFIALRATSLCGDDEDCVMGTPAIEISELAVSKDYERRGVGKILFGLAIRTAAILNEEFVGVKHVVLCADEKAKGFYEKMGCKDLREYFHIPREGWNKGCTPMMRQLYT